MPPTLTLILFVVIDNVGVVASSKVKYEIVGIKISFFHIFHILNAPFWNQMPIRCFWIHYHERFIMCVTQDILGCDKSVFNFKFTVIYSLYKSIKHCKSRFLVLRKKLILSKIFLSRGHVLFSRQDSYCEKMYLWTSKIPQ